MWPLFKGIGRSEYDAIKENSSLEKDDFEKLPTQLSRSRLHKFVWWFLIFAPWLLTVIFFSTTVYYLSKSKQTQHFGSFETGFRTELASSRHLIEMEKINFSGNPGFNPDGSEYLNTTTFIGPPSDEIDAAWDALTDGRFIRLTDEEALDALGPDYKQFWNERSGGYTVEFGMYHTLHCINHIRMSFYPEYYHELPIHGEIHRDHCIDHLRQMMMCYGDMTPIPTRWQPSIGNNYVDMDRTYTCRNFDKIRTWTTERFDGQLAVPQYHRGHS